MELEQLVGTWQIDHPLKYMVGGIIVALVTRIVVAVFRAIELCAREDQTTFASALIQSIKGVDPDPTKGDYWAPCMLGFLESLVYPVLMFTDNWLMIGGWITLKTIAQWDKWKTERPIFNRFLIGNALVIIGAFILLVLFVGKPFDANPG